MSASEAESTRYRIEYAPLVTLTSLGTASAVAPGVLAHADRTDIIVACEVPGANATTASCLPMAASNWAQPATARAAAPAATAAAARTPTTRRSARMGLSLSGRDGKPT